MLHNRKGLTLIEFVVGLALFAVLAGVALVNYNNLSKQADEATVKAFTSALRAAAILTYANVALGNVPGTTTAKITIKSVYNNLEEKGGIQIAGDNYFMATINRKHYRWQFTPPLKISEGTEY